MNTERILFPIEANHLYSLGIKTSHANEPFDLNKNYQPTMMDMTTAGMIISGAYVGDKFSPLSDTTNLAAAVAETGLFDHVTAMVSTTGPTLVIALILYTILGLNVDTSAYDPAVAQSIQDAFRGSFNISPVLLIPIIGQ